MAEEATVQPVRGRARLRSSTTILLVGNIEPTIAWYKGFIKILCVPKSVLALGKVFCKNASDQSSY
jgi:hypothetical protein